MKNSVVNDPSRRKFLCTATAAAAAGVVLSGERAFAAPASQAAAPAASFQLFTAEQMEQYAKPAFPGNKTVVDNKNFSVILTAEQGKSAKEFEWHEGRDHILNILEGTTVYVVGGTPKNGRNIKPGEWLAPESEGATTYTLKKGDMLVIPRGTPHKRLTEGSVILTLVSPMGATGA